jgi:hypothetical protein
MERGRIEMRSNKRISDIGPWKMSSSPSWCQCDVVKKWSWNGDIPFPESRPVDKPIASPGTGQLGMTVSTSYQPQSEMHQKMSIWMVQMFLLGCNILSLPF